MFVFFIKYSNNNQHQKIKDIQTILGTIVKKKEGKII